MLDAAIVLPKSASIDLQSALVKRHGLGGSALLAEQRSEFFEIGRASLGLEEPFRSDWRIASVRIFSASAARPSWMAFPAETMTGSGAEFSWACAKEAAGAKNEPMNSKAKARGAGMINSSNFHREEPKSFPSRYRIQPTAPPRN